MRLRGSTARGGSRAAILQRAAPALIGMVVIAALAGAALRVGAENLRAAEQDRLGKRADAVVNMSRNVRDNIDPAMRTATAATPFAPGGGPINEILLRQFQTSDEPGAHVGLLGADGRPLASIPAGDTIAVGDFGTAWRDAVGGRAALTDVFRHRGAVVNATLLPVGGPAPWGVVAIVEPALHSPGQGFNEQMGSLNGEPGGLVLVDRNGVAVNSWSREALGRPVLAPAEVSVLEMGQSRVWTGTTSGREITYIGTSASNGYAIVFEQETAKLYGDLEEAQRQRDVSLFAVLAVALVSLIGFQLWRERAARRGERRVHGLLKNSQDLVLVVTGGAVTTFVSPAAESLLGISPDLLTGRSLFDWCHAEDVPRLRALLERPNSGPLLNVRLRDASDGYGWFDIEAADHSGHPEVRGLLLTCHGIGERKQLQDELVHQASHDRLTGLPNRAELGHRLARLVPGDRPVRPFALLYLDLDHFKPINDQLGHDAGDEVLVTVADRLRAGVRPGDLVSRLGGDEFVVVLEGSDETRAVAVAMALIDAVRSPIAMAQKLIHLDASIGIALAAPDTAVANAEDLVRRADTAMYRAKQRGRGRYAFAELDTRVPAPAPVPVVDPSAPDTSAPTPAPAPPAPSGDRGVIAAPVTVAPEPVVARRWSSSLVGVALAVALVVPVAALGWRQARDGERAAETEHVQSYEQFAVRAAAFYSRLFDSEPVMAAASNAPWTLDGSPVDATVVKAFAQSRAAGRDAVAVLATPEGRVLTAFPEGTPLTVPTSAPVWTEALAGRSNQLSWVEDPDQPRSYFMLPIVRDGRVAAVLALGISVRHGRGQVALEQAGSAGSTTGGWSLLNADGIVYMSWNPGLIGTRMAERVQLAGLPPGTDRDLSDDTRVRLISPMTSTLDPTYLAFSMPAADFYREQRLGQTPRALSFLALVAGTVIGLAFVNHRRERAVRRSEARLDALLQSAHDVVVVLDPAGRVTFVSSAVRRLLGYAPAERTGTRLLDLVHPDDRERAGAMSADTRARGAASAGDIRVCAADGGYRWFDFTAVDLRDHPAVRGVLLTCHEVTERRALQDELAFQARHDALTGLPNRAVLTAAMAQLAAGDHTRPFAVLFIDLDYFKAVNDRLGHDAGDEVLRVVARRFQRCIRADGGDGTGDLVCRVGGDEFAVVLRDATEAIARATAERLIEAAGRPIPVGGHTVHIGATIGVSQSDPDRTDPEIAMRLADQAMYEAKQAGRGTYAWSDAAGAG